MESFIRLVRDYADRMALPVGEVDAAMEALLSDLPTLSDPATESAFYEAMGRHFVQSRAQPGEPVGMAGVLGLLVTKMQAMLSSHHSSGIGSRTDAAGNITLRSVLYPKNVSNASMRIGIAPTATDLDLRGAFVYNTINDILILGEVGRTDDKRAVPSFAKHWMLVVRDLFVEDADVVAFYAAPGASPPMARLLADTRKPASVAGERFVHLMIHPVAMFETNLSVAWVCDTIAGLEDTCHTCLPIVRSGVLFIGLFLAVHDTMEGPSVSLTELLSCDVPKDPDPTQIAAFVLDKYGTVKGFFHDPAWFTPTEGEIFQTHMPRGDRSLPAAFRCDMDADTMERWLSGFYIRPFLQILHLDAILARLLDIRVGGLPGIHACKRTPEGHVVTRGSNLTGVRGLLDAELYGIVFERTFSSDVAETQGILGIESVIDGAQRSEPDAKHSMRLLLSCLSFHGGAWCGMGRYALSLIGNSVISRMSNDSPATHVRDAAFLGRKDALLSTSSSHFFATDLCMGTGGARVIPVR